MQCKSIIKLIIQPRKLPIYQVLYYYFYLSCFIVPENFSWIEYTSKCITIFIDNNIQYVYLYVVSLYESELKKIFNLKVYALMQLVMAI